MRKLAIALALFVIGSTKVECAETPRQHESFDKDWQFHLGDSPGAEDPKFDTSTWRQLDLPHDWSVEGEFSRTNASCTGYLPGGIGWYRKTFSADYSWAGRKVFVTFDGVYRDADVWINGHHLGHRPYGYSSFEYDLTPLILTNARNILAVRVERENVADSRWYPGSGIYRHVWLTLTAPVHVPLWGNYVTTPRANADSADVVAHTEVTNETAEAKSVRVFWEIEGPDSIRLTNGSRTEIIAPSGCQTFSLWQKINRPKLWSPDTPTLCTLVSCIVVDGEPKDETRTSFGIRTFYFDANQGFFLNGQNLKLKGVCLHHDGGVVGAAVPEDLLERRLKLVKEIGGNAVRCSHNPMAPELYFLCDRLGLLVMDEAFDEWEIGKRKWVEGRNVGTAHRFGYSKDFQLWAERDSGDMVRRDRNHPCIIMWSLGNEIDYPTDPYVLSETRTVEGFARDANQPQQTRLTVVAPKLISSVKHFDPTRPVTMALANMTSSDATGLAQMLDVVGYNYQEADYPKDHERFPTRVIYGSENSRGLRPWAAVRDNPYVSGQFLWVGFDFLGEAGQWPNHGSQSGLFDTRGFKKPAAWQQQALWSETPMVYIGSVGSAAGDESFRRRGRPERHWNWPENAGKLRVVIFSNCDKVSLLVNGHPVGEQAVGDTRMDSFSADYQPGELAAVGYRNGSAAATNSLVTAGEAAALRVEVDKTALPANGHSVAHAVVSVVDARGNLVLSSRQFVTAELQGAGRLLGVDNGDQNDPTTLSSPTKSANGGQVLALVQSDRVPGELTLKVHSPGLQGAEAKLRVD